MMRGIDVSAHNGVINWPAVKGSGIEAVIIRAGYGNSATQQDKQFAANIKGAAAAGLKIGIYWFSYADSVQDALKEWAVCKSIIEPYRDKITLPVVYDYEYDSVDYYKKIHGAAPSNALINQMVNAFLGAAQADGWGTALYTNNDYRLHVFTVATLAAWDIWLADYSGAPDIPCPIQQTSSTGSVPGINSKVDLNTLFKDYGVQTIVEIDTTMDISYAHGTYYTVKTICPQQVTVTAGTGGVVTIVPLPRTGNEQLFALVSVGQPGQETGIYTAAPGEKPLRRFKYKIK